MADCKKWHEQVKRMGRTHLVGDRMWLAFSGSGIAFEVTGKRCVIRLHGDSTTQAPDENTHTARYALYVNGERVLREMMMAPEATLVALDEDTPRTVQVMLVKLSESAMSTLAIDAVETDGTLSPLPDRAHLIEFVGDSITCGYGADTTAPEIAFHTNNEDVTKAYAWQAADLLDVDRTMVSLSGYGVLSGWTGDPTTPSPTQLIPLYYEKVGFSYANCDDAQVQDWPWAFEGRQPEIVVVNLGTNDASYTVDDPGKQAQFREKYQAFLHMLRRHNPQAHILCLLGVMGDVLYPSVAQCVTEYSAQTGDTNIEAMHLEAIRPDTEGYASDFHPTVATHTRIAGVVAEKLRELLK